MPNYKVIESKVTHESNFDYEITVEAEIQFDAFPDKRLFSTLDSLIVLQSKKEYQDSSRAGYWSRDSDWYNFNLIAAGETKYVRSDGFFYLSIKKYSKNASLTYGNY